MKKEIGSIVVSPDGDVILLMDLSVVMESPGIRNGHIDVSLYDVGIFLRGEKSVGKLAHIPSTEPIRVVANVSNVLRLLEQSGVDLTPARK
jgi:hypothetical protein